MAGSFISWVVPSRTVGLLADEAELLVKAVALFGRG